MGGENIPEFVDINLILISRITQALKSWQKRGKQQKFCHILKKFNSILFSLIFLRSLSSED
jgi:hypothetical protein